MICRGKDGWGLILSGYLKTISCVGRSSFVGWIKEGNEISTVAEPGQG
jgi:hypothetical protein